LVSNLPLLVKLKLGSLHRRHWPTIHTLCTNGHPIDAIENYGDATPSPCSQSQSGGNYLKKAKIRFQDNDFLRIDDSFPVDQAGEMSKMVQKAAPSSSAWRRIIRFHSRKIKMFVE
jgi:hypothetical protein